MNTSMEQCWRWYGDLDHISLPEIRQTGATGIVTALHEIPYGEIWPREAIAARRAQIQRHGLQWSVCESLPVHENIKRGHGNLSTLFAHYRQSMAHLAAEGVKVICYNFMPLLDWTRTDLKAPVDGGGTCLRFDATKMAAFELHMLKRRDAAHDYADATIDQAAQWYSNATLQDQETLLRSIMSGLPGAFDRYDIQGLRAALKHYSDIDHEVLRGHYQRFLDEVMPTAQELGMRLCVHPDDPPRDILGLPRIVSTAEDVAWILNAYKSDANGLTLCTGSLGANPHNDVAAIARAHASRIHFAHLRSVRKEPDGSFDEAAHLSGDTDMVEICTILLDEQHRRRAAHRPDWQIPFRPDHGHELLDDIARDNIPGYPLIGRLKGLAEIRGVLTALQSVAS